MMKLISASLLSVYERHIAAYFPTFALLLETTVLDQVCCAHWTLRRWRCNHHTASKPEDAHEKHDPPDDPHHKCGSSPHCSHRLITLPASLPAIVPNVPVLLTAGRRAIY